MPRYEYECPDCQHTEEHWVPFEARKTPRACECGGWMEWQFPVSAALGFKPFESFYHEGLGVDINGRRELQQILKANGYVEAGDKVGGARNEETSVHAQKLDKQPLQGISLSDLQKKRERQKEIGDNMRVGAVTPDGRKIEPRKLSDYPNATKR